LKELQEQERESINTTDPDCVKVKGRQGIHAGYNGQIVVDEKQWLIVHSDVVNDGDPSGKVTMFISLPIRLVVSVANLLNRLIKPWNINVPAPVRMRVILTSKN